MEHMSSESNEAGGAAIGADSSHSSSSGGAAIHETTAGAPSLLGKLGLSNKHFFDETAEVKLSDVKLQLDNDSDKEKLIAMKRLLAMISKGRDVSPLFPDVVKNVVSKNIEIRKIVYMFLVHYAELRPQEALLAINSLQKAMSDPNQLLRAIALRCMSNIRVREIAQLIVMAVQKGSKDSSPYVRKTAALAIPKIVRLDQRHTEQCIEIIAGLLKDPSTAVIGSAIQAFLEVCPNRFDLIHASFRRICTVLPDIDEWSQVAVLTLLLRYGRSQFVNPNKSPAKKESSEEEEEKLEDIPTIDADHRLILQSSSCLFQSRNNAVVLATCSLHFYLAPSNEVGRISKPMIRLLHTNRETSYIALMNIASMASTNPQIFTEHVSEFFVCGNESLPTRLLKLEILTLIANEQNITKILKEMREYAKDEDKSFVAAAVQAIGRCAAAIPEVSESCMQQLLQLMANPSQAVVAEAVVVIKKLLQMNAHMSTDTNQPTTTTSVNSSQRDIKIIKQLAKLLDTIQVPQARAAIVWLVGEYSEKVPQRAPDVLRLLSKSFCDEADVVKLQVITLAAKLSLVTTPPPPRSEDLLKYVLQLAKYDQSYDIRDRARLIRQLLFTGNNISEIRSKAKTILLSEKPIPSLSSTTSSYYSLNSRQGYTLATLSHAIHDSAPGYEPLPEFPEIAPDATARNPIAPSTPGNMTTLSNQQDYDTATSSSTNQQNIDGDDGWGGEYGVDDNEKQQEQEENQGEQEQREDNGEYMDFSTEPTKEDLQIQQQTTQEPEEEEEEDDIWNPKPKTTPKQQPKEKPAATTPTPTTATTTTKPKIDSLDELFGPAPTTTTTTSSSSALLSEMATLSAGLAVQQSITSNSTVSATDIANVITASTKYHGPPTGERAVLLKPITSNGLAIDYAVCRKPSLLGTDVATVNLYLRNTRNVDPSSNAFKKIHIGKMQLDDGVKLIPFTEIPELNPGSATETTISVRFASFTKSIRFDISTNEGDFTCSLLPQPGDLIRPTILDVPKFKSEIQRLSGMYKTQQIIEGLTELPPTEKITARIQEAAYVAPISSEGGNAMKEETTVEGGGNIDVCGFVGDAIPFSAPVIIVVKQNKAGNGLVVDVHTENAVIGSILLKQLVNSLKKQ